LGMLILCVVVIIVIVIICFGMITNSFAAINDQPFPLPRYFGIGHLSSLASGAQTILWMAQKFSGRKGRSSAVRSVAARDGFVGSAEPVALGSSPANRTRKWKWLAVNG
jgi:hypothetical protein